MREQQKEIGPQVPKAQGKLPYSQPRLSIHGNVEQLTQSNQTGSRLDMTFQAGTLLSQITLS